jgi:hypothetical protein
MSYTPSSMLNVAEQYREQSSTVEKLTAMATEQQKQLLERAAKAAGQKKLTGRVGLGPIDPSGINALSTNYSVAPGMAWIELMNVQPLSAGVIHGEIPIWGSGQLLGALNLPLACVIIRPTVPIEELEEIEEIAGLKTRQQIEKERSERKQQQSKADGQAKAIPQSGIQPASGILQSDLQLAQLAGMAVETQATHIVNDDLNAQNQALIDIEIQQLEANQPAFLTPEQQSLTGMSPQGFPGLLPGLRSASALPVTLGVQGVQINTAQFPAEVYVRLVGSGQVPAFSRWLIFTVTGV